jgi:hypothetical protein
MNRLLFLFLLCIASISADTKVKSPIFGNTAEGKSVYVPLKPSPSLTEERRIQQEDQNLTRHGIQK